MATSPWPVRNWAMQQEASSRWVSEASSVFTAAPHITTWASPPVRSVVVLDSYMNANPTLNCTCEGSRFHVPYENHPETTPPPHPVCGKIVFHKTGPWCQKGWGPLLYILSQTKSLLIPSSKSIWNPPTTLQLFTTPLFWSLGSPQSTHLSVFTGTLSHLLEMWICYSHSPEKTQPKTKLGNKQALLSFSVMSHNLQLKLWS